MVLKPNMTRAEVESSQPYWRKINEQLIETRCLDRFYMYLDARDASLTDAIKDHGYWEAWITAWHTANVKPGTVYIDGGANVGYYSFVSMLLGADVIAFEPNPQYADLIRQSRHLNGITDRFISVVQKGLSDVNGKADLYLFENFDGSASIVNKSDRSFPIETVRLDDLGIEDRDVILKLDIEGAEERALLGAQKLIASNNVTVVMEYSPGAYSDDFWHLLESFGQVFLVDYEGNERAITHHQAEAYTDWITLVVRKNT